MIQPPCGELPYDSLTRYCDTPERTGKITVALKADRNRGYALWLQNAGETLRVVDNAGHQVWFRTVDQVLEELVDVPYLDQGYVVDRTDW